MSVDLSFKSYYLNKYYFVKENYMNKNNDIDWNKNKSDVLKQIENISRSKYRTFYLFVDYFHLTKTFTMSTINTKHKVNTRVDNQATLSYQIVYHIIKYIHQHINLCYINKNLVLDIKVVFCGLHNIENKACNNINKLLQLYFNGIKTIPSLGVNLTYKPEALNIDSINVSVEKYINVDIFDNNNTQYYFEYFYLMYLKNSKQKLLLLDKHNINSLQSLYEMFVDNLNEIFTCVTQAHRSEILMSTRSLVSELQQENHELKQRMSKLEQENHELKQRIRALENK